jgi:hypothetical protein
VRQNAGCREQHRPDEVARQHDRVRQLVRVEIDQAERNADRGQVEQGDEQQDAGNQSPGIRRRILIKRPEAPRDEREERARAELDERVARGDRLGAGAAAAAQREPRDDGDVVVGLDLGAAARAGARRGDDREAGGNAVDDDVEERADEHAEDADECGQDPDHGAHFGLPSAS